MKSTEKEYWQLVWEKFRNGDRGAFNLIYSEFIDSLFAYGSKITNDKELLKDAIQDLFIDIYTYGTKLRQPELLEFYLFKSLKRNLIKKLKEAQKFTSSKEPLERFNIQFTIEEEIFGDDTDRKITALRSEITSLTPQKKELLFLKFNSGLSYEEIGKILDIKPETAKKQIYRLLKSMRKKIDTPFLELFMICCKT